MKKMLLLCTGLFLAAGIASAEVVSTNIVGYLKTKATGRYFTSGSTFINVGHAVDPINFPSVWRMGDIIPTGMNPLSDVVQFLNPTTINPDLLATYIDEDWALEFADDPDDPADVAFWVGWWKMPNWTEKLNDRTFPASQGFLCNVASSGVSFTFFGEVLTEGVSINLQGEQYPLVANFQPVTNKLGKIVAKGVNPLSDVFQVLNSTTLNPDYLVTYIDEDWALDFADDPDDPEDVASWVGWWRMPNWSVKLNNYELIPGASLLGNLKSSNVVLQFPSLLATP